MTRRQIRKQQTPEELSADQIDRKLDRIAKRIREPGSIAVQVANVLRRLIFSGELRPGDRVVEWKIGRQLGIGQPTAREALLLLEAEGLVQRNPNRGCTVTRLSIQEIDHIYAVRVELEPLAVALAVDNSANWKPELISSALNRLTQAAKSADIKAWHQSDLEFHELLWRLAANPFLERALSQVCIPFFAFAELVFIQSTPRDLPHQAQLHSEIVSGILSGDSKNAQRITRRVLESFWRSWLKSTEQIGR